VTHDLRPYPAMKDSGVPWLGQVPEHWQVLRGGALFSEAHLPVRDHDGIVTCFRDGQVTLRTNRRTNGFMTALKEVGYQGVKRGHLVIHSMDAFAGAVGVAECDGKCSPEYIVCDPKLAGLVPGFFSHALRFAARSDFIQVSCAAVRERAPRLRYPNFGSMLLPVPSPNEQAAIVRFLDHADRRIRRYIRAKQDLVKLLEERFAARASEAMRHPACATERLENVTTECVRSIDREDAQSYVALGLYNRGRGIFHKRPTVGTELGDSTFSWVEPGDLVISGQFAWEGAVALASCGEDRTVVSHRYYLLRGLQGRSTTPYLWALLRSDFGAMLLDHHSRGAAGRNRPLNLRALLKEPVPVPPYEMQLAVDELVEAIAPMRTQAALAVNLCREFRTRLIADVVTGKLDVREAAARLPEEAGESGPIDEVDAAGDAEAHGFDDADEVLEEAEV